MSYLAGKGPRTLAPPPGNSIGYDQLTAAAQQTLAPLRNRFINGQMNVRQRGLILDGLSTPAGSFYTLSDGYIITVAGSAVAVSSSFAGRTTRFVLGANGAAGNTGVAFQQRVESLDTFDLAGAQCVISGEFLSDTGNTPTFSATMPTAVDNYTATTAVTLGTPTIVALGSNWFSYQIPVTMPAGVTNGFAFQISFGAVVAGKAVRIAAWQLEKGTKATPLEFRPYLLDYAICRRRCIVHAVSSFIGSILGFGGNQGYMTVQGLEGLRRFPDFVNLNGGVMAAYFGGSSQPISGLTGAYGGAGTPISYVATVGTLASGQAAMAYTSTAAIEWRAEI